MDIDPDKHVGLGDTEISADAAALKFPALKSCNLVLIHTDKKKSW